MCQNVFTLGTLEQGTKPTNAHIEPCNDPTMPGLLSQEARPGVAAPGDCVPAPIWPGELPKQAAGRTILGAKTQVWEQFGEAK